MNSNMNALKAYNNVNVEASVEQADPHQLIQMLLGRAIEKIHVAKGHLQRQEVSQKGEQISGAISIVEALRASLQEAGGDLSNHLDGLYEYISRRLLEANLTNDEESLTETSALLSEIKSAWDEIPSLLATPA